MMMSRRFFFISFILSLNFVVLLSQTNEFLSWHSVTIRKDLGRFRLYLQDEARLAYKPFILDNHLTEGGVKFEVFPYLQIGQFYRYSSVNELEYYVKRHRLYTQMELGSTFYRIDVEWRLRYEIEKCANSEKLTEYTLRNKISVSYDIYRSPLEPYIGFELFNDIYNSEILASNKFKASLGLDTGIGDYFTIDTGIKYQRRVTNRGPVNSVIVVTGVIFTF